LNIGLLSFSQSIEVSAFHPDKQPKGLDAKAVCQRAEEFRAAMEAFEVVQEFMERQPDRRKCCTWRLPKSAAIECHWQKAIAKVVRNRHAIREKDFPLYTYGGENQGASLLCFSHFWLCQILCSCH